MQLKLWLSKPFVLLCNYIMNLEFFVIISLIFSLLFVNFVINIPFFKKMIIS